LVFEVVVSDVVLAWFLMNRPPPPPPWSAVLELIPQSRETTARLRSM